MRKLDLAALALVAVTGGACGPTASPPGDELPELSDRFEETFNTGDVDGLAALFAEDARLLPAGFEPREGREAITAVFREFMAEGQKIDLEPIETVVAGDIGWRVATQMVERPDGAILRLKHIETWQQVDGQWKITNLIWNSDTPPDLDIPTLLVTHEVTDAEGWLAAWQDPEGRHERFARHGAPLVRIFRSLEDPNVTGLMLFVEDMEALRAFMDSPEAGAERAEDGVVEATLRVFAEVE